jgi:signal transduction histidine kinase
MSISFRPRLPKQARAGPEAVAAQVCDYTKHRNALGAQRLLIFAAALVLQAFYVGAEYVAVSVVLIIISEAFDGRTFQQARSLRTNHPATVRAVLRRVHMGVLHSSLMISFFALSIALAASGGNSFVAMLYLLAVAVFAAMTAHQLGSVMAIRLVIYSITGLAIPFVDVLTAESLFNQNAWFNFLISLFAFYFIVDASVIGLRYHRANRRQLAQLRAENARAVKALDEKARVLSCVKEELYAPLISLRASLDRAETFGPMTDDAMQALATAQRTAARLTTRIDEILEFHECAMNEMSFDFCDVQLARLIAGIVTDARSYALAQGITLKMMPVDMDIIVRADPMRLEQVITDILANAIRLSDRGSEVILRVDATLGHVRIRVSDQGRASVPENRTRALDALTHVPTAEPLYMDGQRPRPNISEQIIEAHGGLMGVEPSEAGGTAFYVQLTRVSPPSPHPMSQPDIVGDS